MPRKERPIVNRLNNGNKKGFKVEKSERKKRLEAVKGKDNPTNRDIADLLEEVLERLDT
ncbi:hypothetical protein [Gracilibacillus sp. YIM 98692]|uniref:hypothetical protein n=1 Tax=Gracilibacillus sp. YIM 98692 TaxID=2663532 RepID=UPI0013D861AD|nr:hypothetical protein [Gracilibacillus sp. YIM 98692]